MASLKLNLQLNFVFTIPTNIEYSALTESILHQPGTSTPVYRVIASGGTPPYLYSIAGTLNNKFPPDFAFETKSGTPWYNSYADLVLTKGKTFTAADVSIWPVAVTCKDSAGLTVTVNGTISIANGLLPYTLAGLPANLKILTALPLSSPNKKIPLPLLATEQRARNVSNIVTITSSCTSRLTLILVGKPAGSMLERKDPKVNNWTLKTNFRSSTADRLYVIKYWFIEVSKMGVTIHPSNRIIVYAHGTKFTDY
jgi:hypothetical protein